MHFLSVMDFSAAKALLQRKEGDASAYDLLTEVVLKILSDQPANAVSLFEELSASVKASTFPASAPDARAGGGSGVAQLLEAKAERRDKLEALFKMPGGEDGAAGEPVQNFPADAHFLEWAGVTFGRTTAFHLHLSLKHLAAKHPLRGLRFWGKVLGTSADYFVAECETDALEDESEDAKDALGNAVQRTGDGPNKLVYFVCNTIGDEWARLPNVTPHQVVVARKIRRFFSGHLDAPVTGHPPFPGKEAEYLRAQIALITAGTAIAPTGAFQPVDGDEDGAIQPNEEEWEAPDLAELESWVHTSLELNRLGRSKPNPPATNDEGEEVVDPEAPEPSQPLRPAVEDPPVTEEEEGAGAWDIRPVPTTGVAEGESSGVVVLRSLRWPGAFTVGHSGKKYASVYVGWGHEVVTAPFQPALPPAPQAEYLFTESDKLVVEQPDVLKDPQEGKEAEEGDGEEA